MHVTVCFHNAQHNSVQHDKCTQIKDPRFPLVFFQEMGCGNVTCLEISVMIRSSGG